MPTLTVNGHQVTVDDSFLKLSPAEQNSTVDEISKSLPQASPAPAPAAAAPATSAAPSGVIAGAEQGLSHALSGPAETLKDFAGVDTSGAQAAAKAIAPKDYKAAQIVPEGGHWYNPASYNWSQVPQFLAENAPSAVESIAAARLLARINPELGAAAGAGVMALNNMGDTAKQAAVTRTGNADAEPEGQDKLRAVGTQALQTIPQMVQVGRFLPGAVATKGVGAAGVAAALKKAATTAGVEGAAGAASDVAGQVGQTIGTDKGLTVDPNEVANAGVGNAIGGAALAAPRTLTNVGNASRFSKFGGDNATAAETLANKISKAADGSNLGNTGNGFDAVQSATQDLKRDLKAATKATDVDPQTANILARAQKLQPISDSDLAHVDDNAPPEVAQLARQAHVAAMLTDMGNYGGDKFSGGAAASVGKRLNAAAPRTAMMMAAAGLGLTHGSDMLAASPAMIAAMTGGYLGLRGIDSLTGARSPAAGFVDRFGSDTPIPSSIVPPPAQPTAPSVSPTGPKVPFNPGVAGGGTALAMGQNPFTPPPQAPAATQTPQQMNEQVKSALLMAAARRKIAAQQASASAPPAPNVLDPRALNEQVKSALLMASARRKVAGQQSAEGLASESPIVNDNGGLATLQNPAFGQRAQQLLSAARAHAALTAQPEQEEAPAPAPAAPPTDPQAPAPSAVPVNPVVDALLQAQRAGTKINKKNGKVNAEAPGPDYTGGYTPLTDEQMPGKGMLDRQFADMAKNAPGIQDPEAYADGIIRDRVKRRGVLADLTGDAPIEDQEHAGDLLDQLHHIRRGDAAAKAITHYTAKMTPETRDAIRKRMDRSFLNSMWSK